jgi:NAD(P)-dependent dehydrogenase (short-subunit alcohol dehydrogenase family)
VKHLARAGAKVYLAARNGNVASEAIEKLKSQGLGPGNGEVVWLRFKGLSDPREAKKSAEEFLKLESRLDIIGENT